MYHIYQIISEYSIINIYFFSHFINIFSKFDKMSEATRRLLKDLKKIEKEEDSGINATPINDNNIFEW